MPAKPTALEPANLADPSLVPETYSGNNVRASWPFSLHDIRVNTAHCTPAKRDIMIAAFMWCNDAAHPLHKSEFARRVDYAENTIYKVYTGKHKSPEGKLYDIPDDLAQRTAEFLRLEKDRFLGGRDDFVVTPTAKRIFLACDLARESQTPVFLLGPSQIGKTKALSSYASANNHGRTTYTRMAAASGLGGMVRRIAAKHGVSPNGNTADLIDRTTRAITPEMCMILDEMHLLSYTYRKASFFACMEVIRQILDESGCGLVLCGTMLFDRKTSEARTAEMEQLLRRGVHRVVLPSMPSKADLTAIFKHHGLPFPARSDKVTVHGIEDRPYDIVRQLAKNEGLKAITERVRYARKIAAKSEADLSWEHVVQAHLTIAGQADSSHEEW